MHNKIEAHLQSQRQCHFSSPGSVCLRFTPPWPGNALLLCVSANPVSCLWIPHPFWKYYQSIWTTSNPSFPGTNTKPPALAFCFYISHSTKPGTTWFQEKWGVPLSGSASKTTCQERGQHARDSKEKKMTRDAWFLGYMWSLIIASNWAVCEWITEVKWEKNKPIGQSPEMWKYLLEKLQSFIWIGHSSCFH